MEARPILSVNMRRRNAMMHTLLATNETDDIICVQEPWLGPIGVARARQEREGVDVLGGAAHPNWDIHYPYFTADKRAKVMVYTRKFVCGQKRRKLGWCLVVRHDIGCHPSLLILDLHEGDTCLCVVNFYHDIEDPSSLTALINLDLDPAVPTLLLGDFNLHSLSWSPAGLMRSAWAPAFETWALVQTFELQTPPSQITRRGNPGERASTLDLTWHNAAMLLYITITPPQYDWGASLASDHVGVCSFWFPAPPMDPEREVACGFQLQVDDSTQEAWLGGIASALPPLWTSLPDARSIELAAASLQSALEKASITHLRRAKGAGAHAHRWWNEECATLATQLRELCSLEHADPDEVKDAAQLLKTATCKAKRSWADHMVTTGDVWKVAGWHHGRRMAHIAALRQSDGELTFEPAEMAEILAARFFTKDAGNIALHQHDDPEPRPTRTFVPFTSAELERYLKKTKSTTAPGLSGESWGMLKLAWEKISDHITFLANACVCAGYHPVIWHTTLVVVIPKPGREDYALAKNYRPISLLECLSKLVEKAVSKRLMHDIDAHCLIRTNQFGMRAHSSTLDAGLSLVHDVQVACRL